MAPAVTAVAAQHLGGRTQPRALMAREATTASSCYHRHDSQGLSFPPACLVPGAPGASLVVMYAPDDLDLVVVVCLSAERERKMVTATMGKFT